MYVRRVYVDALRVRLSVHLLSTYSVPVSEATGNKKSVAAAPRGSQAGGNSQVLVVGSLRETAERHGSQ